MTLAVWGSNRIINQQCGLTWLATLAEASKYYSSSHQLSAMQVVTWNDYEEGTEIESGIDNCVALAPTVTGSTLSWSIGSKASESTILTTTSVHFHRWPEPDETGRCRRWHALSQSLAVQFDSRRLNALYVEAVGKASIVNSMSFPVAFNPNDQAPVALLSLSTASGTAPLTVRCFQREFQRSR